MEETQFSSLTIRTGDDDRLSTPLRIASARSNPRIFLPKDRIPSPISRHANSGRISFRSAKEVSPFVQEAKENQLTNIEFYPLQPIPWVPDVYSTGDVCIIPLKKGVIGNGTPSKAPILMACKRIIVNAVESWSKYSQMFDAYNMGYAVDVYDYDGLAEVIRTIKRNPEDTKKKIANAFKYGAEHFSSTRSTSILMEVMAKYARKS